MSEQIEISVIIPTYNRCERVLKAINSILSQETGGVSFELIIVDNNSTDDTGTAVRDLIERTSAPARYIVERRQGVSYARNTGVASAGGPILAFLDDDIVTSKNWVAQIKGAMDRNPDIDFIGGKVLPVWPCEPPSWLTSEHWMPLALLDYGDNRFIIDSQTQIGLITANFAVRSRVLASVGGFSPELQRVKDSIGSMEDHELVERLISSGAKGLYVPQMIVKADVDLQRLRKKYHRRWHYQHGAFYALYRSPRFESTSLGRLFDVPAHLYRQSMADAVKWTGCVLSGRRSSAFSYEMRLRFFAGFFAKRRKEYRANGERGMEDSLNAFHKTQ